MNRIVAIVLFAATAFESLSAQEIQPKITDRFHVARSVKMQGYIGKKLDQSYDNRVIKQNVAELIEPFRHRTESRMWQSEFWGKWFTSAVLAYRYRPEPAMMKVLQSAVKGLISTQTPDGYIGNYSPEHRLEQWDIWGRKYCMLGLLDYYDLTGDKASLDAAVKVANHLLKEIRATDGLIVNKGNYRGMAASSVLEPIVRLYRITQHREYLDFALEIVREWETPAGPNLISKAGVDVSKRFLKPKSWYSPEQGQKAYEMMSCYEGLLELYRVTGEEKYREAVEKTWQNIHDTEINITGSGASEEMWFGGNKLQTTPVTHFQETCVTVTWIKLNQQLLRLTGDSKYADQIEWSYYNSLLASLSADGSDWAKYTPLNGERLPGSGQCGMNLNCCDASGPRGQFTLPLTAVMSTGDGLAVNFYVNGSYILKTPSGKNVSLVQKTEYPISGEINISLDMPAEEEMTVQIRIPAWSKINKVRVNKEEVAGVKPGEYLTLKRKWSSKDQVTIELDMRGRVEIKGGTTKYAAITRGPIVLARDSRLTGPSLVTIITPLADKDGYIVLKPVPNDGTSEYWMRYSAMFKPESYTETGAPAIEIILCDYASAGKGKEKSVFEVWLAQLYSGRADE
ncbi:MAG: beta-L-arabinofuranosidase domain-containing protein [Chitinophagaceae bacterium]